MHIATTPTPKHYAYGVLGVDVTILEGHASEVCTYFIFYVIVVIYNFEVKPTLVITL